MVFGWVCISANEAAPKRQVFFLAPPGPVTYCVLLKGYGRQRRLRGVDATMREMKERGVVPDVVALNAAVDAFVR